MRDKVKRFISILMTALMLVNLMPVGALADGITSIGYKPEVAASTGNYTVYVYARFDGDPLPGVTLNASQWYTIGYIKDVNLPSPGGISWWKYWYYNNNNYCGSTINSTSASGIIGGLVHQYNTSIVINPNEWISANFKACPGADTYKEGTSEPTWHLDIIVDINKNPPVHNLVFKVNNSNGKQIGTPKKVTGRWTNPLSFNTYTKGNPVPDTIIDGGIIYKLKERWEGNQNLYPTKIYFNEPIKNVEFYYKEIGPVKRNYTVNHYWMGEQNKPIQTETKEADLGSTVTKSPIKIDGYTPVSDASQSITITEKTNEINFYYYKNVELEANSKTVPYNGQEQSVSGFTGAPEDADFSNITVGAAGTNVGEYTAAFAEGTVDTVDGTEKYIVTKAINGTLKITPNTDKVTVTITEKSDTVKYDGNEHTVTGYKSMTADNTLYDVATSVQETPTEAWTAKGTNVGEYPVGIESKDFKNTNANFSNVEFVVVDGKLEITPNTDKVVVTITENSASVTYDGKEHTVTGYKSITADNPLYDVSASVEETPTEAWTAKGTDVGEYPVGIAAGDFKNTNETFTNVEFVVVDGTLKITPVTDKVVVTITENSDTVAYDGKEHTVTGYKSMTADNTLYDVSASVEETPTDAWTAKGTNVGEYPVGIAAGDFKNTNETFTNVEFVVVDGTLKITPNTDKVVVTITEKSGTATYDGGDHIVSGYASMTADNELYDVDASVQETPTAAWTVKGKDAGEYPVGIAADDFKNINTNFENVKFVVVDGKLTITPAPVTLQAPIQSKTYDGTPLEATQFGHSYLEGVNFADDFASVILTGSQTLVGSSASLITGVIPNEGKKLTNYNFTFVPGTLTITDGTGEEEKPVDPAKVITKTHIPKDTGYNLGEPVTFTISVKNIYNTPKTITLTEKENVKFSNGESVIEFKDVPAGETVTAEATYTITSADILEGVFHNTVTADFTGGGSWTAEDTVTTAKLDTTLNVTKTSNVPDGQKAALGQTITYTIKVQNAGNVPYTNVKVEDPLTKLTATIETLAVGETKTFTTEYVVTEADVLEGHVLNTATAKGDKIKDPASDEKQKEPNGGDEVETKTFAPITIKPKDVTATYNGAAITGKDVEITSGKLLEGHKLSAAVIGSGVNAGSYELTLDPEKITIVDANNKDVSEMYARTILPGKLIINKRSVLITSQSATKTYDGSALTRPAVTITGDGFVPGELAKAEATGSITKVGSTPNAIRYTTTGAFNAANYSIALSVGTLTVTEKPKPEPRRTFNLTINYVYQNGKRAAASYNRGGLKNGETFDITSPVIAGYTASETVVSGTIYNRDIKVTVIYTADGVNLDDYGVPLGMGNITMNVGDCFE